MPLFLMGVVWQPYARLLTYKLPTCKWGFLEKTGAKLYAAYHEDTREKDLKVLETAVD